MAEINMENSQYMVVERTVIFVRYQHTNMDNRKLTWKIKHDSIDKKLGEIRTIIVIWNRKDITCSKS